MVYVGLDVHRKRTQVAILDEDGKEVTNRNVVNDRFQLLPLLGELEPATPVAFEAAYGWRWLVDLLDELDLQPHLVHARNCKAIATARLKNDKVDARTLAHLLRTDLLPEAWIAPREVRDLRALLRHRGWLVRKSTSLKNRIHAVLADEGVRLPEIGSLWAGPGRVFLDTLELGETQRLIVDDCLALIGALQKPIKRLEKEIASRAKPDARVTALTQFPGIGVLTAMTIVAEIGDIARFATARKLCSWAGLTPQVHNSDRTVRHGHITKQGSTWVRWVLVEAAQKAKTRPPFAGYYAKTARRRGNNIATVAVARKLLTRCFHTLRQLDDLERVPSQVSSPSDMAF
jgi:transposase